MLRASMGIRAHPRLTMEKTSKGSSWHPVSRLRRAIRSSISSFHLADLGGELLNRSIFGASLSVIQRESSEAIPLVNLSERT
jgi:hypothetical protein